MDAATERRAATEHRRHRPSGSGHRRRRPSGEPPPLPRELGRTGRFWLVIAAYFAATFVGVLLFPALGGWFERVETRILTSVAQLRTPLLTDAMQVTNWLAISWTIRVLRWGTIGVLIAFRRWRHLFVFLAAIAVTEVITYDLTLLMTRHRPGDVQILAPWQGYSMPSRPMAGLAVTLIGMAYGLVVAGRPRLRAKWLIGAILVVVGSARIYLAVDHPTDVLLGATFGVAIGLVAFRWFAPNEPFPVSYGRGKAAHLDVGGRRGAAIIAAIRDQLDLEVTNVKPVGLEASGGSTPLRLRVRGAAGIERYVFAKLYAQSHVRADRWYKLGRTILYGALEDEARFTSVRRFVEYEDYTLRLLRDLELPCPGPFGVVEITPEREYMIVMEFFDGAVEIGEAELDDAIIDQGLALIKRMWDEGIAHRDIKPANLMVQDGRLKLIDVFFVQVRPSPWRQAVDLANMMLVLALRTDADRVYERAKAFFSEDELAEAFAAARGVASPTQLRAELKRDGRDLLARFRALAPERGAVSIQRWSVRRVVLTVGVAFGLLLALLLVIDNWNAFA